MFRNKEFLLPLGASILIALLGAYLASRLHPTAGWITLGMGILLIAGFLAFTSWRYQRLQELSNMLKRIAEGDYSQNIQEVSEGDLSILSSEIYKLTITLREQASLLRAEKDFLSASIADISHQLRTPITSMGVMADLLRDPGLPDDKRQEFNRSLQTQLDRLNWLITSLLKLAQLDSGTLELKRVRITFPDLVARASAHLQVPMELKEISFQTTGAPDAGLTCDPNWTAEALTNVLKNCVEHTLPGGQIQVSWAESPIMSELRVSDNGEGIDKTDLPHIFERFYKGRNSSKESIGIGLAMAKTIIERQLGSIQVMSAAGKGTEFTLQFFKQIM